MGTTQDKSRPLTARMRHPPKKIYTGVTKAKQRASAQHFTIALEPNITEVSRKDVTHDTRGKTDRPQAAPDTYHKNKRIIQRSLLWLRSNTSNNHNNIVLSIRTQDKRVATLKTSSIFLSPFLLLFPPSARKKRLQYRGRVFVEMPYCICQDVRALHRGGTCSRTNVCHLITD